MAEMGVFIGWGAPVRGREAKSLEVFQEALGYWRQLEEGGTIESMEVVLLYPHGGDLSGFALLRGSGEALDGLRASDDFNRLISRAGLVVERLGVVSAALGGSLASQVELYQRAVDELA